MDLQVVVICRLSARANTCCCCVPSVRTGLVHIIGCLRSKGQSRRQRRIDSVCSFDLTFIFIKSKMMTIECIEYTHTHTYIYIYIYGCFNNFTDYVSLEYVSHLKLYWLMKSRNYEALYYAISCIIFLPDLPWSKYYLQRLVLGSCNVRCTFFSSSENSNFALMLKKKLIYYLYRRMRKLASRLSACLSAWNNSLPLGGFS